MELTRVSRDPLYRGECILCLGSAWGHSSHSDSPGDQGQEGGFASSPGSRGSAGPPGWASASRWCRAGVPAPVGGPCGGGSGPRVAGVVGGRTVDTGGGCDWRRVRWEDSRGSCSRSGQFSTSGAFSSSALICIDARHWPSEIPRPRRPVRNPKERYEPLRHHAAQDWLALTPARPQGVCGARGHRPREDPRDLRPGSGSQEPLPPGVTCPSVWGSESGSAPEERRSSPCSALTTGWTQLAGSLRRSGAGLAARGRGLANLKVEPHPCPESNRDLYLLCVWGW